MTTVISIDTPAAPTSGGVYTTAQSSYLRPADVVAYLANDVISTATVGLPDVNGDSEHALKFPNLGRSGAVLRAFVIAGETDTFDLDLLLFNAEPTNFADNAALALTAADAGKLVAVVHLPNSGKLNLATGIEYYRPTADQNMFQPIPYTSADGHLYGLLVTRTAFTPSSAAKLNCVLQAQHD